MKLLPVFLLAMMFAFLSPAAARGAEAIGVISVGDPPNGPASELAEATQQLRTVVAGSTPGVLDSGRLRERMIGQMSGDSLAELDRTYASALAAYQEGEFEGSLRALHAVVDSLESLPDGPEVFGQWTRAVMRLARTESTLGHAAETRAALERLLQAAPATKVDPREYPPAFVKLVEKTRGQLGSLPKQKLAITVLPLAPEAKVYIDGRDVGALPASVSLTPGKYRVSGSVGTFRAVAAFVDLEQADQQVVLDFSLASAVRPNAGPGLMLPEQDRAKKILSAGKWLGVDKLLVASSAKDGSATLLAAALYDVQRSTLVREASVRFSGKPSAALVSALANAVVRGHSDPAVIVGPIRTIGEKDDSDLGTPRALGWTAVGTGALVVGCSVFAIVEQTKANSWFDKAHQPLVGTTLHDQYIRKGDTARNAAFVGAAGAGASLLVTGILGYIAYSQTGEVGPFRF